MTSPVGVGLVGCGYISGIYLDNIARLAPLRVVACADADPERARARAARVRRAASRRRRYAPG